MCCEVRRPIRLEVSELNRVVCNAKNREAAFAEDMNGESQKILVEWEEMNERLRTLTPEHSECKMRRNERQTSIRFCTTCSIPTPMDDQPFLKQVESTADYKFPKME